MRSRWLLFTSLVPFGTLATEKQTIRVPGLQRPTLVTRDTFVDQSLGEDEIIKLLGIRHRSSTRQWIEDNSRGLQLGFELTDLIVLLGVVVLSVLQLTETITVTSLELWGSNSGAFAVSVLSEPVLIGLLGASAMGKLKFCSCVTAALKLVGLIGSLTMLASLFMEPEVHLDGHTALTLASSSAVFSVLLVVGKILMAFELQEDPIQTFHPIN